MISFGSTPPEESCAQIGSEDYSVRVRKECKAFINQLRRQFGPEPDGASLTINGNSHEYGTYYEVACKYDPNVEEAVKYAFRIDEELPGNWDAEALVELKKELRSIEEQE